MSPRHEGVPDLIYEPHGQIWSRYPFRTRTLPSGAVVLQKNAYLFQAYEQQGARPDRGAVPPSPQSPRCPSRHAAQTCDAKTTGALARDGETPETSGLKPAISDAMPRVRDEQLYTVDANVVDMGLVYDVSVRLGVAYVLVTMPHRGRPSYEFLVTQGGGRLTEGIRERVLKIPGVRDVVVDLTWEPGWRWHMTDAGRQAIGLPV